MSHAANKTDSEDVVVIVDSQEADSNPADSTPSTVTKSKKRHAEEVTEDAPKKTAKMSKGEYATSSRPGEVEELEKRVVYGPPTLEKSLAKQKAQRNRGLTINNQALREQKDKNEEATARTATKGKGVGRASGSKADAVAKMEKECSDKLARWKKIYEGKVKNIEMQKTEKIDDLKKKQQDALQARDTKHKKEIDEIRDKCDAKEDEWKAARTKYNEEIKSMKAEQREFQKQLKTEKEEEIKNWKPEHSKAVKEKEAEGKEKQKAIDALMLAQKKLKASNEQAGAVLGSMRLEKAALEKALAEKDREHHGSKVQLYSREEDNKTLQREQMGAEKLHVHEMAEQGKRWKLKSDEAEGLARDVAGMKRAMFAMRHGLDRGAAEIGKLKAELGTAKEEGAEVVEKLEAELSAVKEDAAFEIAKLEAELQVAKAQAAAFDKETEGSR